VRECLARLPDVAPGWVAEGARARGASTGEEWLAGPMPTLRMFRLIADSLDAIAVRGKPPLGTGTRAREDGRLEIDVFPASGFDKLSFAGFSAHALMAPGVDRHAARRKQAAFYGKREPEGGVSLVLGAGNVSSIPALDVLQKMFSDGMVCLLKMNPVNEWVGPYLERGLAPLIDRGYLRIVYGGADVGAQLVYHRGVDDVHITGSDRSHDTIVWGPPGPERERRLRDGDPKLQVPITSELGNVSPVAIVPCVYSDDELWFQARNVVTMVVNNASFNCNAAKMLITARGWAQRDRFLAMLASGLASVPPRRAYYPGAADRFARLTARRPSLQKFGVGRGDTLPWALIAGVDARSKDELFEIEPFCGILSETQLGSADPVEFLHSATEFMNDDMWGTLNASFVIHPRLEADRVIGAALDRAIVALRYGTVTLNHWAALGYALGTPPWGGHPSADLKDIQSGLGWVHNTFMLGGLDKSVIRGPLVVKPHPLWFYDNLRVDQVAPRAAALEAEPRWQRVPGLLWKVLV
jgi:aldehyde dehydrogenase (NAD(P)+)